MEYHTTFKGQWLSLNKIYSSNRWIRTNTKNEYKKIFKALILEMGISNQIMKYKIDVRYLSKMDSLNVAGGLKIFEDSMKELGLIIDDSKKYQKGISIEPDFTLNHNEYVITITEIKED